MVTLHELRGGRRAHVSPKEFANLRGCSQATLSRERLQGTGIPFRRDGKGMIWYSAADVQAYFDSMPIFQNSAQYEHTGVERMERARIAKKRKSEGPQLNQPPRAVPR